MKKAIMLFLFVTATCPAIAQDSDKALSGVDPVVKRLIKDKVLPGALVLISKGDELIYSKSFGKKNLATAEAVERNTIYRIFSMSKPITSVAALILIEQGQLRLEDPVSKYIPSFKKLVVLDKGKRVPPKRAMTIKDLFCHTSGLTYGFYGRSAVDKMYLAAKILDHKDSLETMVEKLSKIPLANHPGERWRYGVSVDVLGRVVEIVSKKPLDQFFQEKLFGPLKMKDTGFYVPKAKLSRFAENYRNAGSAGFQPLFPKGFDPFTKSRALLSGGGGLVSTADDYLRFARMLLNKGQLDGVRILESATVELMTRNHLPKELLPIQVGALPMAKTGFGLGVSVRVSLFPGEAPGVLGEFGWSGAASTSYVCDPKEKLIVLTLTQVMPFTPRLLMSVKGVVNQALIKGQLKKRKKFW